MGIVRTTQQHVEVLYAAAWDNPPRQWEETATSPIELFQAAGHAPARRYERFANGGSSTLAAGIDGDDLSLTVKSAAGFPTEGNFRVLIDSEILLVTNVQGRVFIIVRAQEGTLAVSHDDGAAIFHVLTAGALAARDTDQCVTGTPANRDASGQAGRLYVPNKGFVSVDNGSAWDMMPYWRLTPPAIGDFTWVNQETATVTDYGGVMVLQPPSVASGEGLRLLVKSAPTPPYTITVAMIGQMPSAPSGSQGAEGICWRDSASGKIIVYAFGRFSLSSTGYYLRKSYWTNPTTLDTQSVATRVIPPQWPYWIRIRDDGTNRSVELSGDGFTWLPFDVPEARDTFITPDQVGVFANNSKNDNTVKRVISFLHWSES